MRKVFPWRFIITNSCQSYRFVVFKWQKNSPSMYALMTSGKAKGSNKENKYVRYTVFNCRTVINQRICTDE